VCRPKVEGGLGVKDLKWFNISLLAKWRWRLLVEHDLLWKKVLDAKHDLLVGVFCPYHVGINFHYGGRIW
jgi:hypothetical protein